jgi:CRP-like cAMP-binding protein
LVVGVCVLFVGIVAQSNRGKTNAERTMIYSGDYFGEFALLHGGNRLMTVVAASNVKCAKLRKQLIDDNDELRRFHILSSLPMLEDVCKDDQLKLMERLRYRKYIQGDIVVREGDTVRFTDYFMLEKIESD